MYITRHIPRPALAVLAVFAILMIICPALQAQQVNKTQKNQHAMTGNTSRQAAVKGLDDPNFVGKWDFEKPGSFGGWKPLQAAGGFEINDGIVQVNAKSQRPCLDLAGPYNSGQISAVEIRIRGVEVQRETSSESTGSAMEGASKRVRVLPQLYQGTRIYFTHEGQEKFAAEKSVAFDLPLDGKFHVLTIDPGQHPSWEGMIHKIRFDLGDFPHHYELDYIYFHRSQSTQKPDGSKSEKASRQVGTITSEPAKK